MPAQHPQTNPGVLDDLPLVGGEEDSVHMFVNNDTAVQSQLGAVLEHDDDDGTSGEDQENGPIHTMNACKTHAWTDNQHAGMAGASLQRGEDVADDFPLVSADEDTAVYVATGTAGASQQHVAPKRVSAEQKAARAQAAKRGEDVADDFPLVSADEDTAVYVATGTAGASHQHATAQLSDSASSLCGVEARGGCALQQRIGELKRLVEQLGRGQISEDEFLLRKAELLSGVSRTRIPMSDADDAGRRCKPLDTAGDMYRSRRDSGNAKARIRHGPVLPARNLQMGDPSMPGRLWDDNAFTQTLQAVADKLAALPHGSPPSAGPGPVRQSNPSSAQTRPLAKPDPASHTPRVRERPSDDLFLFGPLDLLAGTFTSVSAQQTISHYCSKLRAPKLVLNDDA